jgi:RHS repeat-associated protein
MTDGAGTQTYAYDPVNRLTQVTRGTDAFAYTYDLAGNITRRTYPDATVIDYTYDNDSRMASVASSGQTTGYAYDPAGNLTATTLPVSNGHAEERTYDRAGRLTRIKSVKSGSTLVDHNYTLDPVGNPTQVIRAGSLPGTTTYSYDVRDRLTEVCFQASCGGASDPFIRWTYDGVGNRLTEARPTGTTSYTFNAADEMTQAGLLSYTYDANGNQLSNGSPSSTYDLANRLIATNGAHATTYTYDGDGTRLSENTDGTVTRLLWDTSEPLSQLALERDGQGALLRRYLYGASLISMTSSGAAFYLHADAVGSVTNMTSSNGAPQWTYEYEPFGATRSAVKEDASAPANRVNFAGQLLGADGTYYLRAREYAPIDGRFMQTDPIPPPTGNPYTGAHVYAEARPTTAVDVSGLRFTPTPGSRARASDAASSVELGFGESDAGSFTMELAGRARSTSLEFKEDIRFLGIGGPTGVAVIGVDEMTIEIEASGWAFRIRASRKAKWGPGVTSWVMGWTCNGCGNGTLKSRGHGSNVKIASGEVGTKERRREGDYIFQFFPTHKFRGYDAPAVTDPFPSPEPMKCRKRRNYCFFG